MEQIKMMFKHIKIFAIVVVFCNVVLILTLLFYQPVAKFDSKDIDYLKEKREAESRYQSALEKLSEEKEKWIQEKEKSDSMTVSEIKTNRSEIIKLKNLNVTENEKIRSIAKYNSDDIVRAFAKLKDE